MDDFEGSEAELRQRQKLLELQAQVLAAFRRWWWAGPVTFVLIGAILGVFVKWRTDHDGLKSESMTNLAFYPKSSAKIKAIDSEQLMRVLTRRAVLALTAKRLELRADDIDSLHNVFEVTKDPKNNNFFALKAYGPDSTEAIRRVNAFADIAIQEYRSFRLEDLKGWRESAARRKAEILEEETRLNAEENALNAELGVAKPEMEQNRLIAQQTEKRARLAETEIRIVEAKSLSEALNAQLGGINPAILDESAKVRKFVDKLADCDEQIEKLRRMYTDQNPKLITVVDERNATAADYEAFLAKYGVEKGRNVNLERLDSITTQLRDTERELAHFETLKTAIEKEIANIAARVATLAKLVPRYDGIISRRDGLDAARKSVEATEDEVQYLEASMKNEFYQLERASSATTKGALSVKKMLIVVGGAGVSGGLALVLLLMMELIFGKVRSEAELKTLAEAIHIGSAGKSDAGVEEAFLQFRENLGERKSVFFLPLPGVADVTKLVERFIFQCSMGGLNTFRLEVKAARDVADDPSAEVIAAVLRHGDRGEMPIATPNRISASELAMLEADVKILVSEFDLVLVVPPKSEDTLAARQLMRLCDATLMVPGMKRTPRAVIRKVIAEAGAEGVGAGKSRPLMSLLAKSIAISVLALGGLGGCYTNRLTWNFDQYPDLVDLDTMQTEESSMTPEEMAAREEELRKLNAEPPEEFRINAGDRVKLTVYDHPDLAQDTTVTPDGYIGIVFLGQVKVAGLTLGEAAKKIEDGLSQYVKKPAVGLSPLEISSQTVTIAGGIMNPGIYPVSSSMRIADIYAQAGGSKSLMIDGVQTPIADLTHSYVYRKGKALPIDLDKGINGGDSLHNVLLKKNDYILIGARTEAFISVLGAVKTPRTRPWNPKLGLIQILADCGWLDEEHWSNVVIIRGGSYNPRFYKVNVDAIFAGNRPDVKMEAGDIVYVPHDNISEYNVFIRKLLPTGQLFNMLTSPFNSWNNFNNTRNR